MATKIFVPRLFAKLKTYKRFFQFYSRPRIIVTENLIADVTFLETRRKRPRSRLQYDYELTFTGYHFFFYRDYTDVD